MNFLDMSMSYHYIHTHPNIKEANPLLPEKPSAAQFLLHKGILAPVLAANSEAGQMKFYNIVLTIVVLKNHYIYNTTSRCRYGPGGANYHVDGYPINCT
jgi:hypothetical protein